LAEGPNTGKIFLSVSNPKRIREPEAQRKLLIGYKDRDGINRLEALTDLLNAFPDLLDDAVKLAHKQGRSWAEIGEALGVAKQPAWSNYAERLGLVE
jgi:hypothetical protein